MKNSVESHARESNFPSHPRQQHDVQLSQFRLRKAKKNVYIFSLTFVVFFLPDFSQSFSLLVFRFLCLLGDLLECVESNLKFNLFIPNAVSEEKSSDGTSSSSPTFASPFKCVYDCSLCHRECDTSLIVHFQSSITNHAKILRKYISHQNWK